MITKEDLKKFENDLWKFIVFREYENFESHFKGTKRKISKLECLFYFKQEESFQLRIIVCEELNMVDIHYYFSNPTEEKLIEGTKLSEKIKELYFKKSLKKTRLRLLSKDVIIDRPIQTVDLSLYEKPLSKEEIFSFKDTLEDCINETWKNEDNIKKEIKRITLIGEKGKAMCDLLSDTMFITQTEEVGKGVYRLTVRRELFNEYFANKLFVPLKEKIEELGMNVLTI